MSDLEARKEQYKKAQERLEKKKRREKAVQIAIDIASTAKDRLVDLHEVSVISGLTRPEVATALKSSGKFDPHSRKRNPGNKEKTHGHYAIKYQYKEREFAPNTKPIKNIPRMSAVSRAGLRRRGKGPGVDPLPEVAFQSEIDRASKGIHDLIWEKIEEADISIKQLSKLCRRDRGSFWTRMSKPCDGKLSVYVRALYALGYQIEFNLKKVEEDATSSNVIERPAEEDPRVPQERERHR